MTTKTYTYCVIRYAPDLGAGEMLNVGVVIQGADPGQLYWKFEEKYERLSAAFAGFAGKPYRAALGCLDETLVGLRETASRTLLVTPDTRELSAQSVLSKAIVDSSLGFAVSDQRGGVSSNLGQEVHLLFDRMVTSRRAERPEPAYRSNEQVWKGVYEPRIPPDVRARLHAKTIETPSVDVRFEHAFKNGAWHCVQPLSLDYKNRDTIASHASAWAGRTIGLRHAAEGLRVYFLVGQPRDSRLQKSYEKAIRLLSEVPIEHQIVEESDADAFAEQLSDIVRHTSAQ